MDEKSKKKNKTESLSSDIEAPLYGRKKLLLQKIYGSLSQRNAACNETPRLSHLLRETLLERGKLKQFTILDD